MLSYRQKAVDYVQQQHYAAMAKRHGWPQEKVIRLAIRRMRALRYLGIIRPGHLNEDCIGLDNPFIEDHGWKFMVRESMVNVRRRRAWAMKQNQTS